MALPSSPTHARNAVITALTTVTGATRGLASNEIYKRASPTTWAQNLADLKKQPRCFVVFRDPVLDGEMENGSSIVMHWTVQITTWWWMGSDQMRDEVDTQLGRIEESANAIRAALCYPGALALDGSDDTGLVGHALRSDAYRAQGPDEIPTTTPDGPRALRLVHYFRASVETLQPT